ncbi:MAG: DUF58 domain-containing protein [Nitrospinales bacterium]
MIQSLYEPNYLTLTLYIIMAKSTAFQYDPDILAQTSSLKIQAVNLVDGLLSGQHRSRHKGSSVEFAEYKDYSPGDDIRHIDWKVVGKTDKYHVKQFEQSTNLKSTILLDASGSMRYERPNRDGQGLKKLDYARTLAAALSYLLLKQFDAVGLALFNEKLTQHLPPRSKPSHFQQIIHCLESGEFNGDTHFQKVVEELIGRISGRGMLILISDLLSKEDDIYKTLKLIRSRGLEVMLFHILDPDEISLPFEGDVIFESLEDDPEIGLDPEDIRKQYQKVILKQIEYYRKNCLAIGVDYMFMETTTPLEQALKYFLLRRKSLRKL